MKKLYIKFYSSCPTEQNINNFPGIFPWIVRELDENTVKENDETVMTYEEYAYYLESHRSEMESFLSTLDNHDTIQAYKQLKADEIYEACDFEMKERNQGIISQHINVKIDCREIDILRDQQLITMIQTLNRTNEPINYICYDNSTVQVTYDQLKLIHAELTSAIMSMLYHKHVLYAQLYVDTCDTQEKIDAIKWNWGA